MSTMLRHSKDASVLILATSKLLLIVFVLLVGDQAGPGGVALGQAYILPPAYPSMSFSMLRMPSYGGGSLSSASSGDQIQQRNLRRPQRLNLIQRILEQQQQQLQQQLQQQQQQQQQQQEDEDGENQLLQQQQQQQQQEEDGNLARKSRRSNNNNNAVYDSYGKFEPNRFAENSPEWNMAMIKYLIDMKNHGHKIKEIETTKPLPMLHKELTQGGGRLFNPADSDLESSLKLPTSNVPEESTVLTPTEEDPVICKMEPFNVCYRLDSKGNMHPLGDRRPVRLLRVYK